MVLSFCCIPFLCSPCRQNLDCSMSLIISYQMHHMSHSKACITSATEVHSSTSECSTHMLHPTATQQQRLVTGGMRERREESTRDGSLKWSMAPLPLWYYLATSGGWGPSATVSFRRLAGLIATKHNQAYSTPLHFIRCKISFSLIDSASMCLWGLRSSFHAPANDINFCDQPLDLVCKEAQLGD